MSSEPQRFSSIDESLAELRAAYEHAEEVDSVADRFAEPLARLGVVLRLGEAFAQQFVDELDDNTMSTVKNSVLAASAVAKKIIGFDVEDPRQADVRKDVNHESLGLCREMINKRIHLREHADAASRLAEADAYLQAARSARDLLTQQTEQAQGLITRTQNLAAELASGELSGQYRTQARNHAKAAKVSLGAASLIALLEVAAAIALFARADPDATVAQVIRASTLTLFILGVGLFAVRVAVRSYRANEHLRAVNEQRVNALNTFRLFRESIDEDDAARAVVTAELVKAVFAPDAATGFLDTDTSSSTGASDGANPLLTALLMQARDGRN